MFKEGFELGDLPEREEGVTPCDLNWNDFVVKVKNTPTPLTEKEEKEQIERIKKLFQDRTFTIGSADPTFEIVPQMYQMIADEDELHWFFDHVIMRPQVNESYSAVFVSRHKKLTDEETKTFGVTRKEGEFLATVAFKLRNVKDASSKNNPELWTFEQFLQRVKRFNVDKGAYTTSEGKPIPEKTLAVLFYVNPCDDMKVCKQFVDKYNDTNERITKAALSGKMNDDIYAQFQWFGKADSNIKHYKAQCKGSKYWMDFDIDVPKWFKEKKITDKTNLVPHFEAINKNYKAFMNKPLLDTKIFDDCVTYYDGLIALFDYFYHKGNYVVVDTSGGYHILVRTTAIKDNPTNVCNAVQIFYEFAIKYCSEEPYVNEKGECKFECVLNDSQIPGLPLPGTYQYGRPVTVLNKEDFE